MADVTTKTPAPVGRTVRADTLVVAPEIVGLTLAEPWRRFAAMVVDLAVVALLSLLSGAFLGLATGALLIVLFGNSASAPVVLKLVRTVCRLLGAILVVLSVFALGHVSPLKKAGLELSAFTGRPPSAAMTETVYLPPDASASAVRAAAEKLERQVEALKAENRALEAAGTSWVSQSRAFANTLGVTFGWGGVYFTLAAGAFGGRTLGKLLLRIRAVKTDGKPFTFFDAFVRNGGYVAGVAMGFTGFLRLLWEPNRQAVEDKIAGTVVVRQSDK
jgi:uncharacterized RDD family membrane protein YckC